MDNILLLGRNGQVGWELCRSLAPLGNLTAFDFPEVDFADPESLRGVVRQAAPRVIVNAVAYTAVDKAESEADLATRINADAVAVLAEEAVDRDDHVAVGAGGETAVISGCEMA